MGEATPATRILARPRTKMVQEFGTGMPAARRCAELLEPGGRVFGFTAGEFSLLDLLRALIEVTGPADVVLSTWTAGIRDAETAAWLVEGGQIRSLMILTDRSFPRRQPAYCARVLELFGERAIVCSLTHAKFATLRAGDWRVVVRSSMNLNRNRRWEQFDVDDDADLFGFVSSLVEDIVSTHNAGAVSARDIVDAAFDLVAGAAERKERPEPAGSGLLSTERWTL